MANIRNIVSALLPNMEKSEVVEDLRLLIDDLQERTIPVFKSSAEHFAEVGFDDREVKDFDKVFGSSVVKSMGRSSIRVRGNYIEVLHDILVNASESLVYIQSDVEKLFDKDIAREGLDYKKANYLKFISICGFLNKYANKLLFWTFDKEQRQKGSMVEDPLNKAESKWMTENRQAFFRSCVFCSYDERKIKSIFKDIPLVDIIPEEAEIVEQNLGAQTLDPFRSSAFSSNLVNPIYTVRLAIAAYQVNKYKVRKEEVKSLEYRLLLLKDLEDGGNDPELEQEIEFVESRIEKLKYKLAKMEEE